MKKLLVLVAVCAVAMFQLTAATAATQQYDWTRTLGSRVNWVETISLPQFNGNPSLLTGIEIALDTSIDCEVGVENLAALASDLSVNLKIDTQVKKSGTALVAKSFQKNYTFQNVAASDDNLDWAGASGRKEAHFLQEPSSITTYVVPVADFGDYIGNGVVNFDVSAIRDFWIPTSTAGSMAAYYKADVPAAVKVTYTFVPEPGSILALTTGIIGLIGLGIRRRS